CLTRVTRRKGKPEQLDVSDERMLDNILVDEEEATIQERMEEDEMQQMIASEIAGMPEKFRTVLTLFYVQEMSYEEITAVLNQPLGTVKTNLFRARNLLRERVLAGMKGEMRVA
ncbi:MAG: sigW, partial [Bacteroidetes bacterium]|nr:sigW [Bacteroidota bacterium]